MFGWMKGRRQARKEADVAAKEKWAREQVREMRAGVEMDKKPNAGGVRRPPDRQPRPTSALDAVYRSGGGAPEARHRDHGSQGHDCGPSSDTGGSDSGGGGDGDND